MPTSTMICKANALRGCGANHSFRGVKRTEKKNQAIKQQSYRINLIAATRYSNVKCQKQVKNGWYCNYEKNWKHY